MITNQDKVRKGQVDLKAFPLGDVFRDSTFTYHDYTSHERTHRLFSPEYLKRID